MSKFSMEAFLEISWTCFPKKGRAHIFISCPKKNKSFKENLLLIFQSSSFKMDLNRKLPSFGIFWDKLVCRSQTQKSCANIIAYSEICQRYKDFDTWVGRWSNWNGDVIIFSHYFLTMWYLFASLGVIIDFLLFFIQWQIMFSFF